jgi:hypothetical protein
MIEMSFNKNNESSARSEKKDEIQTHNFENAKNALKKFSKELPSSPNFPTMVTSTLFGLLDRNVTGSELNKVTNKVQEFLIATNQQQIRVIKEFDQIYQTFEALDKDYIQGLIAGNRAAEVASNQATKAARKAYEAVEKAEENTSDIKSLIKTQSIIINKLVEFKQRIENIPNIDNVSTMWEDIKYFKSEIQAIRYSINQSETWASETEKIILAQELIFIKIMKFKEEFEAIPHILDLEIIWNNVCEIINKILIIGDAIADNEAITKESFVGQDRKISLQNEKLVLLIEKNRVDFSEDLIYLNKTQTEQNKEFTSQIKIILNRIIKNEATFNERIAAQNGQLLKKIKIAYAVAGAFGAITIIHMILAMLGIV